VSAPPGPVGMCHSFPTPTEVNPWSANTRGIDVQSDRPLSSKCHTFDARMCLPSDRSMQYADGCQGVNRKEVHEARAVKSTLSKR
jgi:hypothetical protein